MQTLETLARNLVRPLKAYFVSVDTTPVSVGARVYNSAAISVPNGSFTALTFNSERYDTDDLHDLATNTDRLTCTRAGTYLITGHVRWSVSATGERGLQVQVSGATTIASLVLPAAGSSNVTDLSIATVWQLNAGDYVRLLAYQTSGGALNVTANSAYSPEFSIWRLA